MPTTQRSRLSTESGPGPTIKPDDANEFNWRAISTDELSSVRILDPACGDAELLVAAQIAFGQHGMRVQLVGLDRDPVAVSVARARLSASSAMPAAEVRDGDFLSSAQQMLGTFDG